MDVKILSKILNKIRKRKSDGILRHSFQVVVFSVLVTLLNIINRKWVSGSLTVENFGAYTSTLAFMGVLLGPFFVFSTFIIRKMAKFRGQGAIQDAFVFHKVVTRKFFYVLVGYALLLSLLAPVLRDYYQLYSVYTVYLAVIIVFFAIGASFYSATLNAFQKYYQSSLIGFLSKFIHFIFLVIIFSVVLVQFKDLTKFISGYNWALFINVISIATLFIFSFFFYRKLKNKVIGNHPIPVGDRNEYRLWGIVKGLMPLAVLLFLFQFISKMDESFARHFLSKTENGFYGGISSIGKMSAFIIHSLVVVVFPKLSESSTDSGATNRIFYKSIILALLISVTGLIGVLLFPELLVKILTHAKYLKIAPLLPSFYLAYIPFAILNFFIVYFTVHHDWMYISGLAVLAVAQVIFYQFYHQSISTIITVMGLGGVVMLLYSCVFWFFRNTFSGQKKQGVV